MCACCVLRRGSKYLNVKDWWLLNETRRKKMSVRLLQGGRHEQGWKKIILCNLKLKIQITRGLRRLIKVLSQLKNNLENYEIRVTSASMRKERFKSKSSLINNFLSNRHDRNERQKESGMCGCENRRKKFNRGKFFKLNEIFFRRFSNFNFHQFLFHAPSFIFYQSVSLGIAYHGVTKRIRRCHTRASQSSFWLMNDLMGFRRLLQLFLFRVLSLFFFSSRQPSDYMSALKNFPNKEFKIGNIAKVFPKQKSF